MSGPHPRIDRILHGPSRWHALVHLPEVGSTNEELASRPELPYDVVCVADRQTAGRGRAGRAWQEHPTDPAGSLSVSVLIEPPTALSLTPLAAGLAVSDALAKQGLKPLLKWPNDLLVAHEGEDRKLAGLLAEHHPRTPDTPARVIVGIGIDVDWTAVHRDDEQQAWTSIAEATGREIDRWDVLADLLIALESWLGELERSTNHVLDIYAARCQTMGRRVSVETGQGTIVGMASSLSRDGGLIVDLDNGASHTVRAGDVSHVRPV